MKLLCRSERQRPLFCGRTRRPSRQRWTGLRSGMDSRRGSVVILALVSLLLVSALIAQQVQRVLADRRNEQTQLFRLQTEKLADTAYRYAVARLRDEPQWAGTTCNLPAGTIHQTNSAAIQITVQQTTLIVTARYPVESAQTCQITRTGSITP